MDAGSNIDFHADKRRSQMAMVALSSRQLAVGIFLSSQNKYRWVMARRKHIKHALCIYQNIVITSWDEEKRERFMEGVSWPTAIHRDVETVATDSLRTCFFSRKLVSSENISWPPLARGDPFVFPTPDITMSAPNG